MITCNKCGKDNQDHYKFCLGCGAELPRASHAPKPFAANTPPQGVPVARPAAAAPPAAQPAPAASASIPRPAPAVAAPAPAPAAAPASVQAGVEVTCPQCGHPNPHGNRFCASCGYNLAALQGGAMPVHSQPAPAAAPAAAAAASVILTALRADGSEAGTFGLPEAPTVTVGRDTGSIFAGDSYLSPRHATFVRTGGQLSIRDEGSLNGVYLKLQPNAPWPLGYSDVFRIGQEIIRFDPLVGQGPGADGVERLGSPARGYIGRIALVIGRDTTGNAFPVPESGIHLGRERGDVLFSEDGYVSGLHCRIARESDGHVYLTDVGSSNGTFVRLRAEHPLQPGDVLLMGQQLFRVDM
ncbi:MAG TPA: FHA domain-containing protein [Polyangiaceae bacterium]|nr:FHA domain-containing protein [Polyangiaceae bacterium]